MLTVRRKPPAPVLDRRGYDRSPVTTPGHGKGKPSRNKGRKFPAEPLTPAEVLALMDACSPGPAGTRDRALIALLWRTGLRCSEALALLPKDVDLGAGRVHVLCGKGSKSRTVGIDQMAASIVAEWIDERTRLGLNGRHPLFCVVSQPSKGQPMHAAYLRNKVKDLARRAAIDKRVHPHGLRHTHAFELAGEGMDLRLVQRQLGHSSLSVTAIYVDHLNPQATVDAIRARAWPGAA